MRVSFTGKSVNISDREREYVGKKLQRVARHFNSAREAHVTCGVQRNWQIVEVQLDLDGTLLRAEARTPDILLSIDQVADKLEEQVRRLKEKMKRHKGKADAPTVATVLQELPEEAEPTEIGTPLPGVVRRKRFAIKAMGVDESVLQMELLNHDFFAFLNADTGEPNVLYRRRDGDYGLLELEV
jgi:putative sigma-54 modulation protein